MAETTGISWSHATQNFFVGCDKIDSLCSHCYIDRSLIKQGREPWGKVYRTKTWGLPIRWQKKLAPRREAWRVFTCSLSDFFHAKADEWRPEIWEIIRKTPNLVYMILTKRESLIEKRLPKRWPEDFPHVWLGVSVGTRRRLPSMDILRRIPIHPEAVRFISSEPLLEDISNEINLDGYGYVITGGESGSGSEYMWDSKQDWRYDFDFPGRRIMKPEWAQALCEKTKARGLPFLMKQATAFQSGQGSNLLGRIWHEFPDPPKGLVWAPRSSVETEHQWSLVQIKQYQERAEALAK